MSTREYFAKLLSQLVLKIMILIREKELQVHLHKVKAYMGIILNEHTNSL